MIMMILDGALLFAFQTGSGKRTREVAKALREGKQRKIEWRCSQAQTAIYGGKVRCGARYAALPAKKA